MGNGLNGIDLVRVWISWRVIPLSRRPGLMCDYTGRKDDPLRHSRNDLPEDVVDDMTKSLLNESLTDCGRTGLSPFCQANPAPAVSYRSEHFTFHFNNFCLNFKKPFVAFFRLMISSGRSGMTMRLLKKPGRSKKPPGEPLPARRGVSLAPQTCFS